MFSKLQLNRGGQDAALWRRVDDLVGHKAGIRRTYYLMMLQVACQVILAERPVLTSDGTMRLDTAGVKLRMCGPQGRMEGRRRDRSRHVIDGPIMPQVFSTCTAKQEKSCQYGFRPLGRLTI
jgi:hypothetical protein